MIMYRKYRYWTSYSDLSTAHLKTQTHKLKSYVWTNNFLVVISTCHRISCRKSNLNLGGFMMATFASRNLSYSRKEDAQANNSDLSWIDKTFKMQWLRPLWNKSKKKIHDIKLFSQIIQDNSPTSRIGNLT